MEGGAVLQPRPGDGERDLLRAVGAAELLMRTLTGSGRPQTSPARRRSRGQSLAELAIAIPALYFLLMGGFDASLMLADKLSAGFAVRQGARLAAELGGSQTNPGATTQQIDDQVVRNVLAVTRG